ncbi:cation channel sperm-associated protein subunit delta isoform X2 [Felis catus]|uniref:cation channel sperm-associated protein subunit delta isoform X2 n=1 Tax=Felis catus TaxID=9685 RepID=UPI001D19AD2E|nr:cation channel sperm-associated protein subunit delta isoform X2 [Felis catus]
MLVLMLVAAATLRLCLVAGARQLCRIHTVRTGKVFHVSQQIQGDHLYFSSGTPRLIKHPCKKNTALYLGRQIFFTRDNFKSSLLPLSLPTSIKVGIPEVTSAHIAGSVLLLVVDQKVYVYDYEANSWNASIGIEHPVSHISGDNCCYSGHPFCVDISNSVFAYLHGDQISQTNVYFSNTRGYTFQKFAYERQGLCRFSQSRCGHTGPGWVLNPKGLVSCKKRRGHGETRTEKRPCEDAGRPCRGAATSQGMPRITGHHQELEERCGVASSSASAGAGSANTRLLASTKAELAGSLGGVFYFHSLSQVGLLLIDQGKAMFSYSEHPLNRSLGLPFDYNGTLDILITPGQKGILIFWFEKSLLVSGNAGQLVYPVPVDEEPRISYSSVSEANVTIHNIAANQNELAVLTRENSLYYGSLGILPSSLIKFSGQNIWSQEAAVMFTDVGQLEILTPLPDPMFPAFDFQRCPMNVQEILMDPQLQVDVCKVELLQGEFDNKMYSIDMNSKLQLTALMIPRPGRSPVPLAMVSNPHSLGLQVAIYEDGYTYDGNTKHRLNISLRQQHHWGRANPNFTSSIKKPTVSTITLDVANKEISCVDLKPLTALISVGCDQEKKIVIQKWREGKFQEVTKAEFVLLEVNGLFTYTYSLTAQMALCRSQPQNWTTILESAGDKRPFAWDRENYISCHDPDNDAPLRWPDVPYQILGGPTANKVIFDQRNGIYVFFLSIVDPYYSYCHLETTFSVYVYGALPPSIIPTTVTIIPLIMAMLLSVWSAYMIPKLLHTEKGLRLKEFWMNLCRRLRNLCPCFQGRR